MCGLMSLIKMQKKCIRNVAGKNARSHTDPLFSSLNILKFEDLFKYNCSCFMNKYSLNLVPASFKNLFTPLGVPNRTHGYQIEKTKYVLLKQFPPYFLPKLWKLDST